MAKQLSESSQLCGDEENGVLESKEIKLNKHSLSLLTYFTLGSQNKSGKVGKQVKKTKKKNKIYQLNQESDVQRKLDKIYQLKQESDVQRKWEMEISKVSEALRPLSSVHKSQEKFKWKLNEREFNKEELLKPLLKGWRREVVMGVITAAERKDVYYYSPCGTKLRSKKEVEKFLIEKGSPFTTENFSFAEVLMDFKEPYEFCRNAALRIPEAKSKIFLPSNAPLKVERHKKRLVKVKRKSKLSLPLMIINTTRQEQLNCKVENLPPCVKSEIDETSFLDLFTDQNEASQKKVLYIEELKEEEKSSPSYANETFLQESDSHSSQWFGFDTETFPSLPPIAATASRIPPSLSLSSEDSDSIIESGALIRTYKGPRKPPIPMFQLELDDSYYQDEEKEGCSEADVTHFLKKSLHKNPDLGKLETPIKTSSKIRVRPIEELCKMDNVDSAPIQFLDNQNRYISRGKTIIDCSLWNLNEAGKCKSYPSAPTLLPLSNPYTAGPVSNTIDLGRNASVNPCNFLVRNEVPVFYPSSSNQNISINVRFEVPKTSAHSSYLQLKDESTLKNKWTSRSVLTRPSEEKYVSHVNNLSNLSNLNNLQNNDFSEDRASVIQNAAVIKLDNQFAGFEHPPLCNFPSERPLMSQWSTPQYGPKFKNWERGIHSFQVDAVQGNCNGGGKGKVENVSQSHPSPRIGPEFAPFSSSSVNKLHPLSFSSASTESLFVAVEMGRPPEPADVIGLAPLSQTVIPSVEKVNTISVEDWLSIQD